MLTALIIIAFFVALYALIKWGETPTKNYTPPPWSPTKKAVGVRGVFDLTFPRLEYDLAEVERYVRLKILKEDIDRAIEKVQEQLRRMEQEKLQEKAQEEAQNQL